MTNYKVTLKYDGKPYRGWQKQGNTGDTIQERIEKILEDITGKKVEIHGSGRTDAGTHAIGQVANFKINYQKSPEKLMEEINERLPETIAITNIEIVEPNFHSRLHAVSKTYEYTIWNSKTPPVFDRKYSFWIKEPLNIKNMIEASKFFIGEHDFKGLTANKKSKKSTTRTIHSINFHYDENKEKITVSFEGNGFLYQMVRIIMGTLIEVGEGKKHYNSMTKIIESKEREKAGFTAPSHALLLKEVKY